MPTLLNEPVADELPHLLHPCDHHGVSQPFPGPPVPQQGTSRPRFPDNLPWWVQTIVSALLPLLRLPFYAAAFSMGRHNEWAAYGSYLFADILFVVVLAIWGRGLIRRIVSVVVALTVLGTHYVLAAPPVLDWAYQQTFARAWFYGTGALFLTGYIAAWSVARRRTPWAAVSLIVVIPYVFGVEWWLQYGNLQIDVRPVWLSWWLIDTLLIVGGVLIVWAFDGLGLLLTKSRPPQHPAGVSQPPAGVGPQPPAGESQPPAWGQPPGGGYAPNPPNPANPPYPPRQGATPPWPNQPPGAGPWGDRSRNG